jgi:hypothetical protein
MLGIYKILFDEWHAKEYKRKEYLKDIKNTETYILKNSVTTEQSYIIHDNGGRPFKVVVNTEGIFVYRHDNEEYTNLLHHIVDYTGYWSGFDSSAYEMHGNSLLININNIEYIHIGYKIYKFTAKDTIIDFISPVGNSDVPYPVAYGTEYVYFMLDYKCIKISDLYMTPIVANAENMYMEFYGHFKQKQNISNDYKHPFEYIILTERI